jgi:hypothetical protein
MTKPISYELAKLLNEKGFDKSTEANWWIFAKDDLNYKKRLPIDESKVFFTEDSDELELKTRIDEETSHTIYHVLAAPTIAQVVMWLYETHKIWVIAVPSKSTNSWYYHRFYLLDPNKDSEPELVDRFNSPQEAYSAAFEYIVKNMI